MWPQVFIPISGSNIGSHLAQIFVDIHSIGYRKNKSYWFLSKAELVYCVYVQSSQWDANDYYVEVGIAIEEIVGPKPSVTRWHVRKRCEDESQNDRNISLSVLKQAIDFFSDILTVNDLTLYLEHTPHTLVGLQYRVVLQYLRQSQHKERTAKSAGKEV